jgi:hypothetical protein
VDWCSPRNSKRTASRITRFRRRLEKSRAVGSGVNLHPSAALVLRNVRLLPTMEDTGIRSENRATTTFMAIMLSLKIEGKRRGTSSHKFPYIEECCTIIFCRGNFWVKTAIIPIMLSLRILKLRFTSLRVSTFVQIRPYKPASLRRQ